jgi:hypothetical protein
MEDQTKNGTSDSLVRHLQIEKEQLAARVQELERSLCSARDDTKAMKLKPADDAAQRNAALGLPTQSVGGDVDAKIAALAFENQNWVITKEEAETNQTRSKERVNRLKMKNRELAAANDANRNRFSEGRDPGKRRRPLRSGGEACEAEQRFAGARFPSEDDC